ncbi:lamin tail domain-containing protein [Uliginosibacterium sp. H3]|uniref:Lamin tail domain-containing protein n=1 Tax=Uliginosibacterium silvisoli TaxID=3114758 RepID=A0ABU6K1S4_9RHOO|nr:lamin tail domain-containing protein [Uliginosibacterium sp. H3]
MQSIKKPLLGLVSIFFIAGASMANAQVRVTEVAPWASGNAPYASDWFELTNFGSSAVSIAGWKMDDSSASFASAVALAGITSIAAGESVIFAEKSVSASFLSTWFGTASPSLQFGTYVGSGVGLSTDGDAVNIYNASGVLQASVSFGVADGSTPYQSFDNRAGLDNTTISQLSVAGVNGAFVALNDASEIGSPGSIAAVPEPTNIAMLLAGLGLMGVIVRKRAV